MRWDWYQATVNAHHEQVIGDLMVAAGPEVNGRDCKPIAPYKVGLELERDGEHVAKIYWGGHNPLPHVRASGKAAQHVADWLRALPYDHRPSRVDACVDYQGPEAWERLKDIWEDTADNHNLKLTAHGDFYREQEGRSLYLGSRKSVVYARCYEKGKQTGGDPDWVRAEVECKPKTHARERVARMSPEEVWGLSRWGIHLLRSLEGVEVPRVQAGTLYQPSEVERMRAWMLRQYGPALEQWAQEVGGWSHLGEVLGERITGQ